MLLAVLSGILLASCTDEQPAGPTARRDGDAVEQWRPVGTFSVPATGGDGGFPLTSTGIEIKDGQRARIEVGGGITLTYNDGYSDVCGIRSDPPVPGIDRPGHCGSGAPWDGQTAGPLGFPALDDAMWVQVWMQRPDGQTSRVGYWYEGSPLRPEITGPGTIFVSRNGFSGYFAYRGVYVWTTSGTNTVRVEVLKPADDVCGGASLNRSAGRAHLDVSAGACPPPPPTDSLVVECAGDKGANQVTRGQDLTCTARPVPAGATLQILGWSFHGDAGGEIKPQEGQEHATTWGGKMVVSGTISVSGTVDGHLHTAQASVTVLPRDWSAKTAEVRPRQVQAGEDDPRLHPLPVLPDWAQDLGFTIFDKRNRPGNFLPEIGEQVHGGPNDDLWFLSDGTQFQVSALYILNTAALADGSAFQALQDKDSGASSSSSVGGVNFCEQHVVPGVLNLVRAHELRHVTVYTEAYNTGLRPILPELEKLVSDDGSAVEAAYDGVFDRLNPAAVTASLAIHRLHGNPNEVVTADSKGVCALRNRVGNQLITQPGK